MLLTCTKNEKKSKKNWLTHKSEVDFEDAAQPIEDFEDVL